VDEHVLGKIFRGFKLFHAMRALVHQLLVFISVVFVEFFRISELLLVLVTINIFPFLLILGSLLLVSVIFRVSLSLDLFLFDVDLAA
jgi:hypothetical protein